MEESRVVATTPNDCKVLVVDDENVICSAIQIILGRKGMKVDLASSSDEALAMVRSTSYNIILLDIKVGAEDGLEILQQIRKYDVRCPVLLMSGLVDTNRLNRGGKLGISGFLMKPFTSKALEDTVGTALEIFEKASAK